MAEDEDEIEYVVRKLADEYKETRVDLEHSEVWKFNRIEQRDR